MLKKTFFILLSFSLLSCASRQAPRQESGMFDMPIYGNWCGLNYPADPSIAAEPIDDLDAACKQHDICYESRGMYDCSCDGEMSATVAKLAADPLSNSEQLRFSKAFNLYMSNSICNGDTSQKTVPSRLLNTIINTSKAGIDGLMGMFSDDEEEAEQNHNNSEENN